MFMVLKEKGMKIINSFFFCLIEKENNLIYILINEVGLGLSWLECLLDMQEVIGSSPIFPTIKKKTNFSFLI